jgi:hypothetical protein
MVGRVNDRRTAGEGPRRRAGFARAPRPVRAAPPRLVAPRAEPGRAAPPGRVRSHGTAVGRVGRVRAPEPRSDATAQAGGLAFQY